MDWIGKYRLFLLDFDGLLVDTERVHFAAYKKMCSDRGFELDWSFEEYIQIAHYTDEGLAKHIYEKFPKLQKIESDWRVLYAEKKANLIELYQEGAVNLMPGAGPFLRYLQEGDARHCVVTHSDSDLVVALRRQHPELERIPYWITRFDYEKAKPNPECYRKAIALYAEGEEPVIGFEDTPRGMNALLGTPAQGVLVTEERYPEIEAFKERGVLHFRNFEEFLAGT